MAEPRLRDMEAPINYSAHRLAQLHRAQNPVAKEGSVPQSWGEYWDGFKKNFAAHFPRADDPLETRIAKLQSLAMSVGPLSMSKIAKPPEGFIKAYRGIDAGKPFNNTGTAWLTTNRDVAEAYAREVWGYENPKVVEVWVNPKNLPQYDMRKLTTEQQKALGGDADSLAPQAVGIYRNADDSPLGNAVRHTTIHAPIKDIWMPE